MKILLFVQLGTMAIMAFQLAGREEMWAKVG